ncbi:phosphoenolpyruvate--protein phosphotransferase [Halobacteriales archaeon QH_10_70_21]|nr:MAG: phosphoenolpyruvate--protein phosphotransferase [Halobacteriales archaeon QH_10_70_21]
MRTVTGIGSTPLSGVGIARWYRPDAELTLPERPPTDQVDAEAQRARVEAARDAVRDALERARDRTEERVGEEEAAIFDAHQQFLDDPQLVGDIEDAIAAGTPAPHAVVEGFDEAIATVEGMDGPMADRADDLRDVRDRLLRELLDVESVDLSTLPTGTVLLAERLTPSDTAGLDPGAVAGIATARGGRTSHAAIIARSLAIPAVVGAGEALLGIPEGSEVLVDGEAGEVVVDPGERRRREAGGADAPVRAERVTTADGRGIEVAANVGSIAELDPAAARGADGVGLFRTEFLFLDRGDPPTEDEQYEAVTEALASFPDGRVVVRTLDIGGDKAVPYLDLPAESNPFLGRRGVRLSLDEHADLFGVQLRALLRAAASEEGADLAVMFPMVTRIEEVEAALDRVESVADALEDEDIEYAVPDLGAMVETPAAVSLAGELAARLDFLSIGTNDLTQYVMAADRENDAVADLHDPLHPAVLRAIDRTVRGADDGDAPVGMCGEIAGDPALTELLVGLGLDELSMSAVTVPAVKQRVADTDTETAGKLAAEALDCSTRGTVRDVLDLS